MLVNDINNFNKTIASAEEKSEAICSKPSTSELEIHAVYSASFPL